MTHYLQDHFAYFLWVLLERIREFCQYVTRIIINNNNVVDDDHDDGVSCNLAEGDEIFNFFFILTSNFVKTNFVLLYLYLYNNNNNNINQMYYCY